MLKEKYLSKFVIFLPILFIVLSSSFITFFHIKKVDEKFKLDSKKLTEKLLEEEKLRLITTLESIDSYIAFQKTTLANVLKDRVYSRVKIADKMLMKMYNNAIGIESKNSIYNGLLTTLKSNENKLQGKYFVYKIKKNKIISDKNSLDNKQKIASIQKLLNQKDEGFIFYEQNKISKLTYIKKFELEDFVIGYSESLKDYERKLKNDVLERLDMININATIFTIDKNKNIIQNSKEKEVIGKTIDKYIKNEETLYNFNDYLNLKKVDLESSKYKVFWQKLKNTYRLCLFSYIKDWEWTIAFCLDLNNISNEVIKVLGEREVQKEDVIVSSIRTALIFILIASFISFLISEYINKLIREYKDNIEVQKEALKNLNSTLEEKVVEKTKQLVTLNSNIIEKFKDEVRKGKQKDQLLYDQSKMAVLGEMFGNIAHQWRQPLSTISTIASGNNIKITYNVFEKEDLKKDFEKIVDITQYLSNTVDDFRNFCMENKAIEKFDIVDVIQKDLNIIDSTFEKNDIRIIKEFENVEVHGVKNELLQAVLNILNNAKDALLENDILQKVILIQIKASKNNVQIQIKDSAGGVPEKIKNKIFEAYFTTKDKSIGTGIGLHMTKQIIENSFKGEIKVSNKEFSLENKKFLGACFTISIPLI